MLTVFLLFVFIYLHCLFDILERCGGESTGQWVEEAFNFEIVE